MGDIQITDDWKLEQEEWLEALEEVLEGQGKARTEELFARLRQLMARHGAASSGPALNSPYMNTIAPEDEPAYPGDLELEARIENIIRWNAQAMVLHAQDKDLDLGGHIATYAASATMTEVLFHHFLRKKSADYGGDLFMFQGHASPGIYARAVWEGRLPEQAIADFRQETIGGVSSYPHPRRMPKFWQAPTVSMGLGPMTALYQARFMKYLECRGLKPQNGGKVWHFIGDGEIDEPEIYGTIGLASRENLDNVVFVLHSNLQRLDGPVRGNGKIIQEVERHFFGAGWQVIKVLWSSDWDEIFAKDEEGVLLARLEGMLDGHFQEIASKNDGAFTRKVLIGTDFPKIGHDALSDRIAALLANYTDDQLRNLRRGGHDAKKVYAAYDRATKAKGPVLVIVKTVKGYGMGKAAEGKNKAHQTKKLSDDSRLEIRTRYGLQLTDDEARAAKFYFPGADAPETKYLRDHRAALGGYLPERSDVFEKFNLPDLTLFDKQLKGSPVEDKDAPAQKLPSTTRAMIDIMTLLVRNAEVGKYIVPIVPDEAQTFGMDPMFSSAKIWNQKGQQYTELETSLPSIMYREAKDGQVLQEGINEDGASASFTAAGTAYALHGLPMVPFYIYYSMFGFQRVGDMVWAAADMMCKGFLLGGTAGRTTLNGEGLQHQDGHSHIIAQTIPSVVTYDPAFAYELAVIVHEGLRRMYVENEHKIFYITLYNENYWMPEMPKGAEEGIKRGLYRFRKSATKGGAKAHLFGSGSIMKQVLAAAEILEKEGVSTDIWSATSWTELYRDAMACDRWNMLHPGEKERVPYVTQTLKNEEGVFVSANDWIKVTAGQVSPWMPQPFVALGTDGFGLSESRENLRNYFEISAKYIAFAAVRQLHKQGKISDKAIEAFMKKYDVQSDKIDPMSV